MSARRYLSNVLIANGNKRATLIGWLGEISALSRSSSLLYSWSTWLMREIKRKQERARGISSRGFLSPEMHGVEDFPLSRRLIIRELSRRWRNIRRISFVENLRCIARARPSCLSLAANAIWLPVERHACDTYVQTLLRAMVTLQNDHLLPQSYYC